MDPGTCVHGPMLSITSSVYDTMSVVPDTGPHVTVNWSAISYAGRTNTAESGGVRSTFVHDWFPVPGTWTLPARSVPIERNSYVWPSRAPVYVPDVVVTGLVSQSVHAPPLSRTWIRYVATSSDSRPHWTRKLEAVFHGGSGRVEMIGSTVSSSVHGPFVECG